MDDERKRESDLIDLTGVRLSDLQELPDSPLAQALRRVLAELDSDGEPVAGFQSAI